MISFTAKKRRMNLDVGIPRRPHSNSYEPSDFEAKLHEWADKGAACPGT